MKAPYFPFYPQDWLSDPKCAALNYEEKGVYWEILCRMWTFHDGTCSLPDDDSFMMRMLKVRPAKWKKLKNVLIEDPNTAVLKTDNGRFFSRRLREEFEKLVEKSHKNSEAARQRWGEKSHSRTKNEKTFQKTIATEKKNDRDISANSLNNNNHDDAPAMRLVSHTDTDTDTEINNTCTNVHGGKLPAEVPHDAPPPASSNGKKIPSCPYQEIVGAYHDMLPQLNRVLKITDMRKRYMNARWRELLMDRDSPTREMGLNLFKQYFYRVRGSPFLLGEVIPSDPNRKPFLADFDWLVRPTNFVKVIEGKYQQ